MNDEQREIMKFTVAPFVNYQSGEFGCNTVMPSGEIMRRIANAEDEAIKRALKALGWCPPEEFARLNGKCEWHEREAIRRQAAQEDVESKNSAMREVIKEAFNSFAEDPESDAAWLLTERQRKAIAKLQPFIESSTHQQHTSP